MSVESIPSQYYPSVIHFPRLAIRTNQVAGQVYTCSGQKGLTPRKASQGGPTTAYEQYSCVVLEQEGTPIILFLSLK